MNHTINQRTQQWALKVLAYQVNALDFEISDLYEIKEHTQSDKLKSLENRIYHCKQRLRKIENTIRSIKKSPHLNQSQIRLIKNAAALKTQVLNSLNDFRKTRTLRNHEYQVVMFKRTIGRQAKSILVQKHVNNMIKRSQHIQA